MAEVDEPVALVNSPSIEDLFGKPDGSIEGDDRPIVEFQTPAIGAEELVLHRFDEHHVSHTRSIDDRVKD